jgi:hypothetical protein
MALSSSLFFTPTARRALTAALSGLALVACAGTTPTYTGVASISGGSIVPVKSAALIQSGAVTEAGTLGMATTYLQFFGSAASTVVLAGSLQVAVDPATLPGKTLTFGQSPDPVLTFNADVSPDASTDDAGDDAGAGTGASLVATAGTIAFKGSGTELTGTINAQMVLASSPGSSTVTVTGTFTAPLCSD